MIKQNLNLQKIRLFKLGVIRYESFSYHYNIQFISKFLTLLPQTQTYFTMIPFLLDYFTGDRREMLRLPYSANL